MSYWLTDPELFLYAEGIGFDDVHLWRCKKPASSSSLVVPMKPDDFDYVSNVKNHLELIADLFDWNEPDFKRLVEYIYENRLLVNSQGFVIAELLHKADKDGNKTIDDANEEDVHVIYIRSLDVLPLKPYIPKLRERPIPLRTVKYLGAVNGQAAPMEEDSKVTKLTTRVENLEAENTMLESQVTKLTARVENLEAENTRLEFKNNTLDTSVTQLTAGLATKTGNVVDLQSKNKTLETENKILDSNAKTLEGKVTKLTEDLATQMNSLTTLQQELKKIYANTKEVWMNGLTSSDWVGIEGLLNQEIFDNLTIVGPLGTYTVDDISTNVRATYWYAIIPFVGTTVHKAISLEDLTPNKEMARFSNQVWCSFKSKGKTYAYRS